MSANTDISKELKAIEQEMHKMLAGDVEAYAAGWNIWGIAMSKVPQSPDIMHPLWLIWGALTDWVEIKPQEKPKAEEEMKRAAREWLSLDHSDLKAGKAYLDRWVFDEMGYKRKGE